MGLRIRKIFKNRSRIQLFGGFLIEIKNLEYRIQAIHLHIS